MAKFRNSLSGEVFEVSGDKSAYKFGLKCKGFDRFVEREGLTRYALTGTLADENVGMVNHDLHRFLVWLASRFRRAGERFCYVWVVELQKKRYRRYGVAALHWHMMIACREGLMPAVRFTKNNRIVVVRDGDLISNESLIRAWRWGRVSSQLFYSPSTSHYMKKYLSKDAGNLAAVNPAWGDLRSFGGSKFGELAVPVWAWEQVKRWRSGEGVESWLDNGLSQSDLKIRRRGGCLELVVPIESGEVVGLDGKIQSVRGFEVLVSVKSPYSLVER